MWQLNLEDQSDPKYMLIAEAIGDSIADGRLAEGDRLPTQRKLADQLGVSLNTISRAYAEATKRGFLSGEVGRGTYVRTGGPLPASRVQPGMAREQHGPIDFSLNLPCAGDGAAELAQTLGVLQRSSGLNSYLDYQAERDLEHHTEAGAKWIEQIGLETGIDQLVLTNGAQHGLLVAMMSTMRPGDLLLTESLTYAPVISLARHLGLKTIPVAMDADGLLPDALHAVCSNSAATALYCLPTLHTPTTITMSTQRRKDIAEVARRHNLTIIEDDVFGFLPPERPPPLACFAPERTLFVTSVSKCLAPGLRVGYLHAPKRQRISVRAAVNLSCWMPPPLMAEIASRWIEDGTAQRLNGFQRAEAQARQRIAEHILGRYDTRADPYGLHLWLSLPEYWRPDSFRAAAEREGVRILTGETFAVEQTDTPRAIRICLSHEPTRERVGKGLEIIAQLLSERDSPGGLLV